MPVDARELRRCLGHFATGVTVVTCEADGAPHGATVNAFSAVSLDPPLVLVSLDRKSKIGGYLADSPFTVNVLAEEQGEVALHFAGKPMDGELEWRRPDPHLAPHLTGALATIACTPWRCYDGGDHLIYLGEVAEFEIADNDPLVFYLGGFRHLGPLHESAPWLESGDCPGVSWFAPSA
ncbi:flavin reductase [Saccharopolyspora rhizosphaerae]|uniref:Flavin reductase n=1 Tax=Saccharopolyspora rhizosphaerae TaxID=2492662 RepID=A0A426JUV7_9PSEU|nr:flavin reductase family protein [Saccharopolyspora rhizosphaerae]RRO16975.1 flavin reductase [Saccharopolyspora rhizosphaerae]